MSFTALNNNKEREKQYVDAIRFYLIQTKLNILFVENSNSDISSLFDNEIKDGRLECITFEGNQNKARGKGYGECEIIKYALENSSLIHRSKNTRIVKITGRLIVRNLKTLINTHALLLPNKSIICAINSNLSFPDSRCIMAPIDFYKVFLKRMDNIDDSIGYFFEHALLDTIKNEKSFSFYPFLIQPDIEGISGSTGVIYERCSHSFAHIFRYIKYALLLHYRFKNKYRVG